ncbi:vacuolar-processing enzyme-like [Arachis duranensis]|uniref:Vacuolar-processing enzyme-like n=1 Tax=Arachis duranensis TaxID=130453 RepID=A0A9C6TWN9_ARADU|nr:vacuolar-processing enzyme-like [Arachis hypogaea]XP_025697536.1 vacuolar-processing enzyme-like [Arachis hypogaea]XP_052118464.1 vacuolar-processing enzyme-like [Arachis duranensis]QHO42176.1 Vacuolar-processing enzyme [Arachis hypogaea]
MYKARLNLRKETLQQQYQSVEERTSNYNNYAIGSRVIEYGDTKIKAVKLSLFEGFDPASTNFSPNNNILPPQTSIEVVNQRDAYLFFIWQRYKILEHETEEKAQALKEITEMVNHRNHIDGSVKLIGTSLFSVPEVKQ